MTRRIVAVLLGLFAGFVVVAAVEAVSARVYPLPPDLDLRDSAAFRQHIETLPRGAFLMVLAAHAVGSLVAGAVCAAVVRRPWRMGALLTGGLLMAAGIANLVMIPHPAWFAAADLLTYLPPAIAGDFLAGKALSGGDARAAAG